ncbi:transposase, partial [Leptospira borgpetersenii]
EPYREKVGILRCFRGVDYLTAMFLLCEVNDFKRFKTAGSFMSFLGLVPGEYSSGSKRKQTGITKTGSPRLRRILTEAVSDLKNLAGLNIEEEKELYLSLKDGIYELPIQSPGIYRHILKLFEDDPEIFLILSTMEELVLRKQQIIESSHVILEKYKSGKLNHQSLFGDLSILEPEITMEILGIFEEKGILGRSEKNLIKELLSKHKNHTP